MLTRKDIDKLAELSRLALGDEEKDKLVVEVSSILGYVGEIQKASGGTAEKKAGSPEKKTGSPEKILRSKISTGEMHNIFREDKDPHLPGEFSEDLLAEAPRRQVTSRTTWRSAREAGRGHSG